MSVDLILGVLQAANTTKAQQAQKKLAEIGAGRSGIFEKVMQAVGKKPSKASDKVNGEDLIAQVMAAADPSRRQLAETKLRGVGENSSAVAENIPKLQAMKKLEGALLTAVVDQIMPKDSQSLYGDGTAGEVARQFQVEGLAEAAAESEPLGLADQFYGQKASAPIDPLSRDQQWPYFTRRSITPYAA